MSQIVIHADQLGKQYQIGTHEYHRFSETLVRLGKNAGPAVLRSLGMGRRAIPADRPGDFRALKDVSFDIRDGEVVGIIGHNGAGKSTLLKILSRITEPTQGRVGIRGRVGSLLEVSTGLHPELTGRENIYLNGAILGMRHRDIQTRFDEIVAFSELERFLDTPVKQYSNGMCVRLGFSIAAHLNPEILILDEVLAVGDANFQAKCLERIQELRATIRCIILITHNMVPVRATCTRVMLMANGRLQSSGAPDEIIAEYETSIVQSGPTWDDSRYDLSRAVSIEKVQIAGHTGEDGSRIETGKPLKIAFRYRTREIIPEPVLYLAIRRFDGFICAASSTKLENVRMGPLQDEGDVEIKIEHVHLAPGPYVLDITVYDRNFEFRRYYVGHKQIPLYIYSDRLTGDERYGLCRQEYQWQVRHGGAVVGNEH